MKAQRAVLAYYNGHTPMHDGSSITLVAGETLTIQPTMAMVVVLKAYPLTKSRPPTPSTGKKKATRKVT